jgi:hypothetical protein
VEFNGALGAPKLYINQVHPGRSISGLSSSRFDLERAHGL